MAICQKAVASVQLYVVQHIMHVRTVSFHENLCDTLAFMLVVSIVWGALYSAGSGSPSELGLGRVGHFIAKIILFLCAAVVNCQIYTPDSAIYSLAVEIYTLTQQYIPCGHRCVVYMTACSAFDPPTHYSNNLI